MFNCLWAIRSVFSQLGLSTKTSITRCICQLRNSNQKVSSQLSQIAAVWSRCSQRNDPLQVDPELTFSWDRTVSPHLLSVAGGLLLFPGLRLTSLLLALSVLSLYVSCPLFHPSLCLTYHSFSHSSTFATPAFLSWGLRRNAPVERRGSYTTSPSCGCAGLFISHC